MITPSDNIYSATIGVGGSQYSQDGMYTILVQQGAQSGDTTYNSLNLLTDYQGGHLGKYKFAAQVEVTSGTTSATSISKSSCYGPCNYDPSLSTTGSTMNWAVEEPTRQGAWNAEGGGILTIIADAELGSTTIDISGRTLANTASYGSADIMLKVTAPNGNVVAIDQVTPSSDGNYSTTISVGGSQYSQNGMYTIIATQAFGSQADVNWSGGSGVGSQQGGGIYQLITASTEVEIVDGHVIPEFGTIAVMILVVAIVAIIAVSAKTKLSLVQRY